MPSPDVVIAGAGLIGLACALECERRGLRVVVLERGRAMQQASWAAAGMLAAHDPANPAALSALAQHSIALYPAFLEHIAALGGIAVPFETEWTLEPFDGANDEALLPGLNATGLGYLRENSLDPRKLAAAVLAAVRASNITLVEDSPVHSVSEATSEVQVQTAAGTLACGSFNDCTGAWSAVPVRPAKGQMLRVHGPGLLHSGSHGNIVVRTEDIYLVPRLDGSVVIGATVEDVGFDTTVHENDLATLMDRAAAVIPAIADAARIESWAGLRPDTPDHLPLLGRVGQRRLIAAGHFRNGILLAPATARVIAQLLMGEQPELGLETFAPDRFHG
jgi:glycine oxidase